MAQKKVNAPKKKIAKKVNAPKKKIAKKPVAKKIIKKAGKKATGDGGGS